MSTTHKTKSTPQTRSVASPGPSGQLFSSSEESPLEQGIDYVRCQIRQHPEAAALWCLGIGFVLGWKLKPW